MPRRIVRTTCSALVALTVTALLPGCIGATDRSDFDKEVRRRGGGLTTTLVQDAISAVEEHVDGRDLKLRSLTVSPGSGSVSLEVQDPRQPRNLDQVVVINGSVRSSTPVRLSATDSLEVDTFAVDSIGGLEDVESLADTAIAELGLGDAYVTSLTIRRFDEVRIQLSIESPRASGYVRFDQDGGFVEARQT